MLAEQEAEIEKCTPTPESIDVVKKTAKSKVLDQKIIFI